MPTHCFSYIFIIHSRLNPISLDLVLWLHWTGSSSFFSGLHVLSRHFSIISLHILQRQRGLTTFCFLKHSPLLSFLYSLFFFLTMAGLYLLLLSTWPLNLCLRLGTIDIWDQIILCCGQLPYTLKGAECHPRPLLTEDPSTPHPHTHQLW